jgi:hypothetical protein
MLCDSEVSNIDLDRLFQTLDSPDHDVSRLDVSMDDLLLVEVLKPLHDLPHDHGDLFLI